VSDCVVPGTTRLDPDLIYNKYEIHNPYPGRIGILETENKTLMERLVEKQSDLINSQRSLIEEREKSHALEKALFEEKINNLENQIKPKESEIK
jgi:hypothetical protein